MLLALVVTALGAAMGGVLWQLRDRSEMLPAQLVPGESLFFAEFPDLPGSAGRWKQLALYELLREPEVRAFLGRAREEWQRDWSGAVEPWKRIRPRKGFLAVASLTNNMPHAVAGFTFDGDREALEPLIGKALIRAQNASPHGQVKRLRYRGHSIEAFSNRGITLAGCFAGKWFLVANDVELLEATLDRLAGKRHSALASLAAYQRTLSRLPAHADFRVFVQPAAISTKLLTHADDGPGASIAAPGGSGKGWHLEAAALAVRMEGRRLHDTLILCQPAAPQRPGLIGKTVELTTPGTLFYSAMAPQLGDWRPGGDAQGLPGGRMIPMFFLAGLDPKWGGLAQFQTAFGPEHALLLEWPEGTSEPHLFLASEIRDPARARRFTENALRAWSRADAEGISIWTPALTRPDALHPAVALTGRHLLAGLSPESLKPFASHAVHPSGAAGNTLDRTQTYQSAMAPLPKPETGLAYLDTAALFKRVYALAQPTVQFWGPLIPALNRYADFAKLPAAATISRHLSPVCLSARQTPMGLIVESTGPVTFVELGAGLSAGALYTALPALREKIPGKGPNLNPPPPSKPLSAPADSASPSPLPAEGS